MSIASRINEIREHLTNTWDDIDSLGIGVKILPNEYTQVDYLESSGTQYIDTGVNADSNLRVVLDMAYTSPTSANQNVGAIRLQSGNTKRYHLLTGDRDGRRMFLFYFNDNSIGIGDADTDRHLFDFNVPIGKITTDNVEYNISTPIADVELNFYLFSRNSTSTIYMSKIKQWACKMYYNNVLVRDFIPCYRNSDHEVGLYDLVNNVFYTNQGTGVFTYGSENIEYIDKNLENVDVALKKLYGTISDKTDMSTNGIKGDTYQETITAETGTNVNAKSISISDVDTDKEHYFKLDGDTSAIIIRFDTIPFYKIFAIVHELGHAYFHYLGRGVPTLMRSNLANESMPRIFEHLFLEYLRNNYLIDHNTLDLYERFLFMHELSITNSVYIVNKLLIEQKIPADFHLENIKIKLDPNDYNKLSIINPKYDKEQEYLGFTYNYYAYAFLLALVMKERFSKDELEARKFIKNFPAYARELESTELINLFDKSEYINSTNKNISRVFSKTIYKK